MSYVNYSWKVFTDDNSGTDFDLNGLSGRHHTFWVGPRSAKFPDRKPIIRWLAPIPIGMDWRRELPTNIHMVLEN